MPFQVTLIEEGDVVAVLVEGQLQTYILDDEEQLMRVPSEEAVTYYQKHHPAI